jgi:hypothetical protein
MFEPVRPRHRAVLAALGALDAGFLERARCYFGGGTRMVLGLGEYRESADVDFLCASREGYAALRGAIRSNSLGRIVRSELGLAREVIADRYGIRTVLDLPGGKLKFEIILEARIALAGARLDDLPVASLDPTSCFAEKFLANTDRWADASTLGRDAIDLAFMAAGWGTEAMRAGMDLAKAAYGKLPAAAAKRAATRLLEQADWRRRCVAGLAVTDTRTLLRGLRIVAGARW